MSKVKKRADGRYCKQVYLGKSEDGKRKYKTFYGETIKAVDAKEREFRNAIDRGLDIQKHGALVEHVFENYLAIQTAKNVGAGWTSSVKTHIKHIQPLLKMPAAQVKTSALQALLNDLADWHEGKPPLAHKTLLHITSTWRHAFDLAVPEIIQYNPCAKLIVPAGAPPEKRSALSEYEQSWIVETPHRAQRAAMLMMYAGLRRGEATALTWADIDLNAGTIAINKAYDFVGRTVKFPKTQSSIRLIAIPQILVSFLQEEKDSEKSLCLYVLHNAKCEMLTESAWKRLWESYMMDLNVKYGYDETINKYASRKKTNGKERGELPITIKTFTPHQLRHTFCTLLYLAGVDVMTARDQMGHSDIKTTMNIYTHLDKAYKRHSMNRLDDYLSATKSSECENSV